MKFSYKLLKKIYPGVGSKKEITTDLTMGLFEVDDVLSDSLDIKVLPNRFSDAASHYGIARELGALKGKKIVFPKEDLGQDLGDKLKVEIKDKKGCFRYIGVVMEVENSESSPAYIKEVLEDCGLRPINLVVDVMNYAMLLTGQPMHAFDYEKVAKGGRKLAEKEIIVRRAKKGEKIETLDGKKMELGEDVLVIADVDGPLAIAGIKGGKRAEVNEKTKKIIIEAASFNQEVIYKVAKKIGITTDASIRFSHNLSSELASFGMSEAIKILKKEAKGKEGVILDVYPKKEKKKEIIFDLEKFKNFTGIDISLAEISKKLELLGFSARKKSAHILGVTTLVFRNDVENFIDLAEEVVRLYGIYKIEKQPLEKMILSEKEEKIISFKEEAKDILSGLGLDEVYNYSFYGKNVGENFVELANPAAEDKRFLRESLLALLRKNVLDNFRFFSEVKIFEVGKDFSWDKNEILEKTNLGIAVAAKKASVFFKMKGILEEFFRKIGVAEVEFKEEKEELLVLYEGNKIGRVFEENLNGSGEKVSLAEICLDNLSGSAFSLKKFEEIVKYPSVVRDVSFLVDDSIRAEKIFGVLKKEEKGEVKSISLIDFYEGKNLGNKKSMTLRINMQSGKRSLTDEEAGEMVKKIVEVLKSNFRAEIR